MLEYILVHKLFHCALEKGNITDGSVTQGSTGDGTTLKYKQIPR